MEKNIDQWNEIADLIKKEKKSALDDFQRSEFIPGNLPARQILPLSNQRPGMRPMITAMAASLLMAVGLISFWLLRASWQKIPAVPALNNLLADSFLYNHGNRSKEIASQLSADSSFVLILTAWSNAGLNRASVPAVNQIDLSAPVEHVDPEVVRQKIEKVIRESSIERMLSQFCQICKEV